MWRFGYPNPVNYNDNELFCGGYAGTCTKLRPGSHYTLYSVLPKHVFGPLINDSPVVQILTLELILVSFFTKSKHAIHAKGCVIIFNYLFTNKHNLAESANYGEKLIILSDIFANEQQAYNGKTTSPSNFFSWFKKFKHLSVILICYKI